MTLPPEMSDGATGRPLEITDRVATVASTLHVIRGRGYCSAGAHLRHLNFLCYDEARAILAALDGETEVPPLPGGTAKPKTLAARSAGTKAPPRSVPRSR